MQKGKMGRTCLALLVALIALGASEGSCLASDDPLTEDEIDVALASGYFVTAVKACMGGSEPPETVTLWIGIDHQGKAHVQGMNPTPNNSMIFNCIMATGDSLEFRPTGTTTRVSCELSTSTGLISEIEIQGVGFEGVEEMVDPQYEKLTQAGKTLIGLSLAIGIGRQVIAMPLGLGAWNPGCLEQGHCRWGHTYDVINTSILGLNMLFMLAGIPILLKAAVEASSLCEAPDSWRIKSKRLRIAAMVFYGFAAASTVLMFSLYTAETFDSGVYIGKGAAIWIEPAAFIFHQLSAILMLASWRQTHNMMKRSPVLAPKAASPMIVPYIAPTYSGVTAGVAMTF